MSNRPLEWLLRLYPKDFRETHGENLLRTSAEVTEGHGWTSRMVRLRAVLDLIMGAIGVHSDRLRRAARGTWAGGGYGWDDVGGIRRGKGNMTGNLISDIKYALRGLRKAPGFTVMAVLTIALGLGANTAIFSVVNGVLLAPLPYEDSDKLVAVWSRFLPESGFDFPQFSVDPTEYLDFRDNNHSMDEVAAYNRSGMTITGPEGDAERVTAWFTTWNLFKLLGSQAVIGRVLIEEDDRPASNFVVVLSHDFWTNRFGADAQILGKSIILNGNPTEVVGVMPQGFSFPRPRVDLWAPLQLDPQNLGSRQSHYLQVVARLQDDVPFAAAKADTEQMMARWEADYPDIHTAHFLFLTPLLEDRVGNVRTALLLLMGAVGFVLLVVCANVANLLLVRGQFRLREVAVRRALGASRWRVIQLGLTESALLALGGGALGLLLGVAGVRVMLALDGGTLPRTEEIGLDGSVLLFSAGLAGLTALVFGLIPSLQGSGEESTRHLRDEGRSGTASRRPLRSRSFLVAAEVALSIVLVLGAGLLTKSFWRLLKEDPGFEAGGAFVANLSLPFSKYSTAEVALQFYDELVDRVTALPGVEAMTSTTHLPMASGQSVLDFKVEGMPEPGPGQPTWNAGSEVVHANYFEVMGMPAMRGRLFDDRDGPESLRAMVISESLADKFFAGQDPVGMRMGLSGDSILFSIVGVVSDVDHASLGDEGEPVYYIAKEQMPSVEASFGTGWARRATLVVRTSIDPLSTVEPVRRVVQELDSDLPLTQVGTLESIVEDSVSQPRFVMTLMALFALLALLLGTIGIYGVTSFVVSQRQHEIGIRRALGAEQGNVIGLVLKQGFVPITIGMIVGLVAAAASGRVLEGMLFDVSTTDPATYAGVTLVLGVVALFASWLPARRAAKVDPMRALRSE